MRASGPALTAAPSTVIEGTWFVLSGDDWPACPIRLTLGKRSLAGHRVQRGLPHPDGVRPDASGSFRLLIDLVGMETGRHRLRAESHHGSRSARATIELEIVPRPVRPKDEGEAGIGPLGRFADFAARRFGELGHVPAGLRRHQFEGVRLRRFPLDVPPNDPEVRPGAPAHPVPGACNWTPVGPGPEAGIAGIVPPFSGRALAIAIDPVAPATMYLGTANGGVWKTTDGGDTWLPKSDHEISLACAAIAIDPRDPRRVFAGTGEPAAGTPGAYYGNGILRSSDGGDTWDTVGAAEFERAEIAEILFDPTDPTSHRILVASTNGVYESPDGGDSWRLLRAGAATALVAYVDPATPTEMRLIAGFAPGGIYTATWNGSSWTPMTSVSSPAFPTAFSLRIAFAPRGADDDPVYALFAGIGDLIGLAVSRGGGTSWSAVDVRLDTDVSAGGSFAAGHTHTLAIPAADLRADPRARTYTTSSAGSPAHTHTVSLTAEQMRALALGKVLVPSSNPDGTGHTHSFYLAIVWQSSYNLAVAFDPADEDNLYIGEVSLWRCRTGGGVFERIHAGTGPTADGRPSGTHVDQHIILPDPTTPNRFWLANDGGIFRTDDGGTTWLHRNRGLATLQHLHASTHPQWETVMLGGTQDNGAQRCTGSPAWEPVDGGDAGFTAIDPRDPFRMYHGYLGTTFFRSDAAGAARSWTPANAGITGRAMSYPPFLLDLHAPRVCWFGTGRLWRTADGGTSWDAVTAELTGLVSALAGDPGMADRIYAATDQGRMYRVERTGPTWAPDDVTVTDLTGPALPAGIGVSDLAVDSAGTVWATLSLIWGAEGPGEFTSRHVFRLPAGATAWEARSDGLVDANPINTIVVDPANDMRLFCGGDVGVFRSENGGGDWIAWDHGLPNAPVFHLEVHGPSRLLRAATHGRSIWERPIDGTACPPVDLYVRDNVLDSGRRRPSPSNEPSPIDRGLRVHWWHCADIKVDAPEPDYQTADPIGDYLELAELEHRTARRERVNRFYAQVHNRGAFPATNVRARAFFTNAHLGLPPLPPDFWVGGNPFDGTPSTTDWMPIGPTLPLGALWPGVPGLAVWQWEVPATAAEHSCLLLVTTCDEDPLTLSGVTDIGWAVLNDKRIGLKNLHVEDAVAGSATEMIVVEMRPTGRTARTNLVLEWGNLPIGTTVRLALELVDGKRIWSPKRLRGAGFERGRPGRRDGFPKTLPSGCGKKRSLDAATPLIATREGKAIRSVLPGILLAKDRSVAAAFRVTLPEDTPPGTYQMDLWQGALKSPHGGCTYRFVVSPPA
jgi:photosystem II stability/assembly factor-like uncharacterized protein